MPDRAAVRKQLENSITYVRSRIYTLEDYTARELLRQYQSAFEVMAKLLDDAFFASASGKE